MQPVLAGLSTASLTSHLQYNKNPEDFATSRKYCLTMIELHVQQHAVIQHHAFNLQWFNCMLLNMQWLQLSLQLPSLVAGFVDFVGFGYDCWLNKKKEKKWKDSLFAEIHGLTW